MTAAVLTPWARRELLAATRWIRNDNRLAAIALREAVSAAAERVGRHPAIGALRPGLLPAPYRFVSLAGFPYVIVYNGDRQPAMIVAVLHAPRGLGMALRDIDQA